MISNQLISTHAQKVLQFLLMHPAKIYYEREIARGTKISYGSANNVLRQLCKEGLIEKKSEGRMCYYSLDAANPYIREFKILSNLAILEPLVERLKPHTRRIILYGSWANGTDSEESDIDLFIVTSSEDKVRSIINKFSNSSRIVNRKIQAVITTLADLLDQDEKDKVFAKEVEQGKILWEKEINEDNL
ncbi:MAG: nucleotidyltransferase domain-containing protein [Candidatus Omnitrophica bacterium]|nr:nucleotidyltransferase domain-containing protein [Candidatus Omnitrophota bacterium]